MSAVIDRFTAMSAAGAERVLPHSDVLEITDVIRSASDDELRALVDLDALPCRGSRRDPRPLRGVRRPAAARRDHGRGALRPRPVAQGRGAPHRPLRLAATVTLDTEAEPDVTIAADIVDFVRLVTGESNAALLYLGGALAIEGDEMLALAVGSVFTVPGSDRNGGRPESARPRRRRDRGRDDVGQAHALGDGGRVPADRARGGLPPLPRLHRRREGPGAEAVRGVPHRRARGR